MAHLVTDVPGASGYFLFSATKLLFGGFEILEHLGEAAREEQAQCGGANPEPEGFGGDPQNFPPGNGSKWKK